MGYVELLDLLNPSLRRESASYGTEISLLLSTLIRLGTGRLPGQVLRYLSRTDFPAYYMIFHREFVVLVQEHDL